MDPRNWPQYRGPGASGLSPSNRAAAVEFDLATGKNIAWKTDVPGLGLGSPVVWADRIFLTTGVGPKSQALKTGLYGDIGSASNYDSIKFQLLCLDRATGRILWTQTAHEGIPKTKRHTKASFANASVATNGKHVIANFGSEGLYCYDTGGKLLWNSDLGQLTSAYDRVPDAEWGFASSPVLYDGKILLQLDVSRASRIMAVDVASGKTLWSTERSDLPTWCTPTVVTPAQGQPFVVANGCNQIRAYDLVTGNQVFTLSGGGDIPVPTPIHAHGLIFVASAHGDAAPLLAIKETARGDISLKPKNAGSSEHIAWANHGVNVYLQTPIVVGDLLFGCTSSGLLQCWDAKTGVNHFKQRLDGTAFTASPVSDGHNLYLISEDGNVNVVSADSTFKSLAVISLNEQVLATPALSDGTLLIRTHAKLIAVMPGK